MRRSIITTIIICAFIASCTTPLPNSTPTPIATFTARIEDTPTATATIEPSPTATPKPLSLDADKRYGQWEISDFTSEQQSWIDQVMTDPDHASMDAKIFYDQVRIEGIKEQTEDQNINLGKYAEWLFNNGIHEIAPLPFAWLRSNLSDLSNIDGFNRNAKRGYLVEGFESLGHDHPNGVEVRSTYSGIGENMTVVDTGTYPTRALFQSHAALRKEKGNENRDTFYGEPFLIVNPSGGLIRADMLVLVDHAGTSPDEAQLAIIRMYDSQTGDPLYSFVRIQYTLGTIQQGETSCILNPFFVSEVCPAGTQVKQARLSVWEDVRREHSIGASRKKMLELFEQFVHPPMMVFGDLHREAVFIEGVYTSNDIKIPTVPPEFLQ